MPDTDNRGSHNAGSARRGRAYRDYTVVHGDRWNLVTRAWARCAAADKPLLAVYQSQGRNWVGLDLRTMQTPPSEIALVQIRTAFECSGRDVWPGPDVFLCRVRSSREGHRLARYVTDIIQSRGERSRSLS